MKPTEMVDFERSARRACHRVRGFTPLVRPVQSNRRMRCFLVLGLVLPACVEPSPMPRELSWSAHAITASGRHTLILTDVGSAIEAGTVEADGDPIPLPTDPQTDAEISLDLPAATAIAVGSQHACVISAMRVTCWGEDNHGALGAHRACPSPDSCVLGPGELPTLPPVRAIAAGDDVTCATTMDDEVMCWGKPDGGRLGGSVVSALDPPVPVMLSPGKPMHVARVVIRDATVCAIDRSQQGWCWGGAYGARPTHLDLTGVVDLSVNGDHGCAIASTGLSCWGNNINGQVDPAQAAACTRGCTVPPTPVALSATRVVVGARHTCALEDLGNVWCWGDNEDGQLGRSDAFLVGDRGIAFTGASDLVAGASHTCALRGDHTAWCWGRN
jgi:alpha-tubulin suppressor-like RCC1 family protein